MQTSNLLQAARSMSGKTGAPGVSIQDRKCRLRIHQDTFVGVEAVEWMIANDITKNVRGAIILGNRMMKYKVFSAVTDNVVGFQNDWVLYRFNDDYFVPQPRKLAHAEIQRLGLSNTDLRKLLGEMLENNALKMRVRQNYGPCFLGNALVKWLLVQRVVTNSRDAVLVDCTLFINDNCSIH